MPISNPSQRWIVTEEARDRIGYTLEYLRRLAREGRVEAAEVGTGAWLLSAESVLA